MKKKPLILCAAALLIVTGLFVVPPLLRSGETSPPEDTLSFNGRMLTYLSTETSDAAALWNFVNAKGKLPRITHIYEDEARNSYRFDAQNRIQSFSSAAGIVWAQDALSPQQATDRAIEAMEGFDMDVAEAQVLSCALGEWGGYQVAFQSGDSAEIADTVIVTLNGDGSLLNFVVQRSGIDSMDEVDTAFFQKRFDAYMLSKPDAADCSEISVRYIRIGDVITASYTLTFSSESSGSYAETVSFAKY